MTLALAFFGSVVVGAAFCAVVVGLFRVWPLERRANVRFGIWFLALLMLTAAAPAFLLGSRLQFERIPEVAHTSAVVPVSHVAVSSAGGVAAAKSDYRTVSNAQPQPSHVSPWIAVVFLWISGTAIALVRIGGGLWRLRALMRNVQLLQSRATTRGLVRVVAAEAFATPVAIGYFKPAILLPPRLRGMTQSELEHVILHEIKHLQRFDDVTCLVQALCVSALWFNPFAHAISHRIAIEREMACDEAVVLQTGGRIAYATTLSKVGAHIGHTSVPCYLSGLANANQLIARLQNLSSRRAADASAIVAAVAGALILSIALVGACAIAPKAVFAAQPIDSVNGIRLSDGDTLIVGGRRADGSVLGAAQLYNRQGSRIALIPMRLGRFNPTLTLLRSGNVLMLGGMTASGETATAEIYNMRTRSFSLEGSMHAPRIGHTATLMRDGRVLIAAGERAPGVYVATTEIYDERSHVFSITADGPRSINETTVMLSDGNVLMYKRRNARVRCAIVYDVVHHRYRNETNLALVPGGP